MSKGTIETNDRETGFAMVPRSFIRSGMDPFCIALFAELDSHAGTQGWVSRGANKLAGNLGWQARTVTLHAKHLVRFGIITTERLGTGSIEYRVVHNPSRTGRANPEISIPPVPKLYRKTSGYAAHVPRKTQDLTPGDCPAGNAGGDPRETQVMDQDCPAVDAGRPSSTRSDRVVGPATLALRERYGAGERSEASEMDTARPCTECGAPPVHQSTFGIMACAHQLDRIR